MHLFIQTFTRNLVMNGDRTCDSFFSNWHTSLCHQLMPGFINSG